MYFSSVAVAAEAAALRGRKPGEAGVVVVAVPESGNRFKCDCPMWRRFP